MLTNKRNGVVDGGFREVNHGDEGDFASLRRFVVCQDGKPCISGYRCE